MFISDEEMARWSPSLKESVIQFLEERQMRREREAASLRMRRDAFGRTVERCAQQQVESPTITVFAA